MPGLGTLINMLIIVVGGLIGLTARNYLKQQLLDTLMVAMSACIIFIGIAGAVQESLVFDGPKIRSYQLDDVGSNLYYRYCHRGIY